MWQNMEESNGVLSLVWCLWEFFTAHKKFVAVKTNIKYPVVGDFLDACPNDIVTEGEESTILVVQRAASAWM